MRLRFFLTKIDMCLCLRLWLGGIGKMPGERGARCPICDHDKSNIVICHKPTADTVEQAHFMCTECAHNWWSVQGKTVCCSCRTEIAGIGLALPPLNGNKCSVLLVLRGQAAADALVTDDDGTGYAWCPNIRQSRRDAFCRHHNGFVEEEEASVADEEDVTDVVLVQQEDVQDEQDVQADVDMRPLEVAPDESEVVQMALDAARMRRREQLDLQALRESHQGRYHASEYFHHAAGQTIVRNAQEIDSLNLEARALEISGLQTSAASSATRARPVDVRPHRVPRQRSQAENDAHLERMFETLDV